MNRPELSVRRCQPADWETIIAIANRAFREIRRYTREQLGDKLADLAYPGGDDRSKGNEVRRHLEAHPQQCLVCESEGVIVGFATYRIDGAFGVISNNGADPDHHIPGTGTALYRELLRIFREEGCRAAKVVTGLTEPFAPARHAYEKAGFRNRLESVTYYLDLEDTQS